ncbi:MAG: hypothetical protein E7356_02565 [Clostridiales bacterium]|nr:hypothetical protein [Clostridiales bacterium]
MAKEKQPLFKCGNDMKINVSKFNGEVVFDEECCTIVGVIMKNTGEIATSFFGAHNPEVIKVLEKSLKMYFKSIKKTLKSEFAKEDPNDIKVVGGEIPEDSKWSGEPVPDAKQDKSSKTKVSNKSSSATKNKKTTKTAPKKNSKK